MATKLRQEDAQPVDFVEWTQVMRRREEETPENERVYLVISKLRNVREAGRKKHNSFASSALPLSSSRRSSHSHRPRLGSRSHERERSSSWEHNNDGRSSAGHDELLDIFDTEDEEQSESEELRLQRTERERKLKSTEDKRRVTRLLEEEVKQMWRSLSGHRKRETSDSGSSNHNRNRSRSQGRSRHDDSDADSGWASEEEVEEKISRGRSRGRSMADHLFPQSSGNDDRKQSSRSHSRKRSLSGTTRHTAPISFFRGTKTADQHWAICIRGRYFELEVQELPFADSVKNFSRFNNRNRIGRRDGREVTARFFVGSSHMTSDVLSEIGRGIMKTQLEYALRSDNCQHFMAVYLPRILCQHHSHLPCLPQTSFTLGGKTTAFPVFEVGIMAGLLTRVEHRYYRFANVVRAFETWWRDGKSLKDQFRSQEISTYTYQLQDERRDVDFCRTLATNPYLLIEREFKRKDVQPLGNLYMVQNTYHLWDEVSRQSGPRSALISELRRDQIFETVKGLFKQRKRKKLDLQQELSWFCSRQQKEQEAEGMQRQKLQRQTRDRANEAVQYRET